MWRARSRKAASLTTALKADSVMKNVVDDVLAEVQASKVNSSGLISPPIPPLSPIGTDHGDSDDPDSEAHEVLDLKTNAVLR